MSLAADSAATPALVARAAFHLARCRARLGDRASARAAFAQAAGAPSPVRDERGRPVRVEAVLRSAALADGAPEAAEAVWALGQRLLTGDRHADLSQAEWEDAMERAGRLPVGRTVPELVAELMAELDTRGLVGVRDSPELARPRALELGAALNRLRSLVLGSP